MELEEEEEEEVGVKKGSNQFKSYLDKSVGGRLMLEMMGSLGSNLELMGLAQAKIDVRAFNVVIIPALAIDTVCCS